jgi:archaellum component FlaC
LIAVFSVAVTTTVGVSTTALVKNANVKSSLETLQAKQEEMLERISTLEDNYEKVKKIISLLQSEIEGIGYQVKGITDSLKLLQNNLPSFMIYVSHLAARLTVTHDRLFDVGRKWKIGVVDEKILEIFNFSLPCTPHCNMNFAEPKHCLK